MIASTTPVIPSPPRNPLAIRFVFSFNAPFLFPGTNLETIMNIIEPIPMIEEILKGRYTPRPKVAEGSFNKDNEMPMTRPIENAGI